MAEGFAVLVVCVFVDGFSVTGWDVLDSFGFSVDVDTDSLLVVSATVVEAGFSVVTVPFFVEF